MFHLCVRAHVRPCVRVCVCCVCVVCVCDMPEQSLGEDEVAEDAGDEQVLPDVPRLLFCVYDGYI